MNDIPALLARTVGRALHVVAFGEAMVEYNQHNPARPHDFLQGFGGDTSNFLVAAARQGCATAYLSALGNDAHGQWLRQMWDAEGVNHQGVVCDPLAPTGVYFVSHGERGHSFDFLRAHSAAARVPLQALNVDLIRQARCFHFSGISLAISNTACDAALQLAQQARQASTVVSFDTNLRLSLWPLARARALSREAMRLCDICLPSWDDITQLSGLNEPQAILDYCLELGAKVVVLKMGAHGVWLAEPGVRQHVSAFPCQPVDATGAGDTFGGAFVSELLHTGDTMAAARYATVAAALSTQGYGAVHPIPKRAVVETQRRADLEHRV